MSWLPPAIQLAPPPGAKLLFGPPAITPAQVDAYFLTSFNAATWAGLTQPEKDVALAEANRWLGTLCWKEDECCGRDFDAAYLTALSELALALNQSKTAIIAGPVTQGQSGTYISKQQLGDLSQEFRAFPASADVAPPSGRVSSKAPLLLQRFPWLVDILHCWMKTTYGSNRLIPVRRN